MAEIKLRAPSSMLVINVLGVVSLLAITVAIGGLAGNWWWSLLAAGVFGAALAVIAMTYEAAAEQPATAASDGGRQPATVPVPVSPSRSA